MDAGDHFGQGDPDTPDVGARIHVSSAQLFRRHMRGVPMTVPGCVVDTTVP